MDQISLCIGSCVPEGNWPPLWALLVSPLILLASASAAVFIALFSIHQSKKNKRSETLIRILEQEQSEVFHALHTNFVRIREKNRFEQLHKPQTEEFVTMRLQLHRYLNHYEMIALGIKHNLLSEKIFREWMGRSCVRDWNTVAHFIHEDRKSPARNKEGVRYDDNLYKHFQWLARRIDSDAISLPEHFEKKEKEQAD